MSRIPTRRRARLPVQHRSPSFHLVPGEAGDFSSAAGANPLSISELEIGLRILGRAEVPQKAFWDNNIVRFRHTVLLAIRDTSDALLSQTVTTQWRVELESQLETLIQYLELADRYVAERQVEASHPTLS